MTADALILAGGKSSRMGGRHKGNLLCHGTSLTERIARELGKTAENVYISYGQTLHRDTSYGIPVQDIYPGCGPMSGLHAGLQASSADFVLTAPCDMPLLTAGFYDYLLQFFSDPQTEAVVPCREGRPEPLAAIYRPSCSRIFERQLRAGQYRIRQAFDQMHVIFPDISEDASLSGMLININTPEDYELFISANSLPVPSSCKSGGQGVCCQKQSGLNMVN